MTLPSRNFYFYIAGALLLAVLAYFGFFRQSAVMVETGLVTRGEVRETIDAEGRTRYHERYVITAPTSGKMFRVQLHEGDRVSKGYVLTRIDPTPPRPLDPSRIPDSAIQPFAYEVYVPEDGVLTKIFARSESIVQAGTPIAEVGKASLLEIAAEVLSSDATKIRPRMPVLIENWGGNEPLRGKIRNVEPQAFTKVSSLGVEEQRVNVIADFDKPPVGLGDNFRVDVRVILWEGTDVLRVPASALFREGDSWMVFVADGGRAKVRKVEVGHRSPSFAHVTAGLEEGESVVLHPPNSVGDGTRINSN